MTYENVIAIARLLVEDEGGEFVRGIVTLIAALFPERGITVGERNEQVAADLGLAMPR